MLLRSNSRSEVLIVELFLLLTACPWFTVVNAQIVMSDFCVTDGAVYAIAVCGNTVYIGGDFTWVGPQSGIGGASRTHIAALDATTG